MFQSQQTYRFKSTVMVNGRPWMDANRVSYDEGHRLIKLSAARLFELDDDEVVYMLALPAVELVRIERRSSKRSELAGTGITLFQVLGKPKLGTVMGAGLGLAKARTPSTRSGATRNSETRASSRTRSSPP